MIDLGTTDTLTIDKNLQNTRKSMEVNIPDNTDMNSSDKKNEDSELNQLDFFHLTDKGAIAINFSRLINYLRGLGFYRFDLKNNEEYVFIQVIEGIAEGCSITKIQDVFFESLTKYPNKLVIKKGDTIKKESLIEKMYKGLNTYFSKGLLSRLGTMPNLSFLEADKDHTYFFFKNCVVKVSKDKIEPLSYKSLTSKIIWKNSILEQEFHLLPIAKYRHTPFAKFIKNITKSKSNDKLNNVFDKEREQALKTIIGYNLHPYFQTKLNATILTDSGLTTEAEGRTGKTLVVKAMGNMLNATKSSTTYIEIAGKNFSFTDKNRYEQCRLDTKLVHINDAKSKFEFELLFNDITEGMTVEGKWVKKFLIYAKILVSSNRTIRLGGGSDKDRALEFQVSDHYSMNHRPEDDFGHWFFRDWNAKVWNEFYNYMIHCVQEYFTYGLIIPKNIDLEERKLREETRPEFVEYMDSCLKKIEENQDYDKADIYFNFIEAYPDFKGQTYQRTFTEWIKKWANSNDKIKEIKERRSGKKSFIKFIFRQNILDDELPM